MADWTIKTTLSWTTSYFEKQDIDSPRLDAEILLAKSLGIERLDLYIQHDRPLEKQELEAFKAFIKRRVQKEPVAYIVEEKGFYESVFKVKKGVLIPRPDTETLVEESIALLKRNMQGGRRLSVLELGAGSGGVVVSLAKAVPGHFYAANDISMDALDIAKENARDIAPGAVEFFCGSWVEAVKFSADFDLIVSNPPYIPCSEIGGLQTEIYVYEPRGALDGGADGLDCYREILDTANMCLASGGHLLLEIGYDQKDGLGIILGQYSCYESIEFIKDLAGHDRVVKIKKRN